MNPQSLKEYTSFFENEFNQAKNKNVFDVNTNNALTNIFQNVNAIYNNLLNYGTHYKISKTQNNITTSENSFSALDFFERDANLRNDLNNLNTNRRVRRGSSQIEIVPAQNSENLFKQQYNLYISTLKNIEFLEEQFNRKNNKLNNNYEQYKNTLNGYIKFLRPLLEEDVMGFNAIKPEKCRNLDDMYSFVKRAAFDTSKVNKKKYGANQSSRFKMTFKFNGGQETTGFFTENEKFNPAKEIRDAEKKFENTFKNTRIYQDFYLKIFTEANNHPETNTDAMNKTLAKLNFKDEQEKNSFIAKKSISYPNPKFFSGICKLADKIEYDSKTDKYYYPGENNDLVYDIDNALGAFPSNSKNRAYLLKYLHSVFNLPNENESIKQEFYGSLFAFSKTFRNISTSCAINNGNLWMFKGSDIAYRNCAMSAVDKLIGTNVLANSHKITTVDNGKIMDGIFMEEANGTDFMGLKASDPRYLIGQEEASNPQLLKSISDLQILDYICGNIDRHGLNFFYKFDKKNEHIIGLVGIDNDSSFTRLVPNPDYQLNRLPALMDLKVIDKRTAERIMQLDKDDLTVVLKPYGLDKDEIDAAYRRLYRLQSAIGFDNYNKKYYKRTKKVEYNDNRIHLTILDDDDWKNINIEKLVVKKQEQNANEKKRENIYNHVNDRITSIAKEDHYSKKTNFDDAHRNLAILRNHISLTKAYFEQLKDDMKWFWQRKGMENIYNSLITSSTIRKDAFRVDKFDPVKYNRDDDSFENYLLSLDDLKDNAEAYLNQFKGKKTDAGTKKKIQQVKQIINKVDYYKNTAETLLKEYKKDMDEYHFEKAQNEDFNNEQPKRILNKFKKQAQELLEKENNNNNIINVNQPIDNEDEEADERVVAAKPNFLDEGIDDTIDFIQRHNENAKVNGLPVINEEENEDEKVDDNNNLNIINDNQINENIIDIGNKNKNNDIIEININTNTNPKNENIIGANNLRKEENKIVEENENNNIIIDIPNKNNDVFVGGKNENINESILDNNLENDSPENNGNNKLNKKKEKENFDKFLEDKNEMDKLIVQNMRALKEEKERKRKEAGLEIDNGPNNLPLGKIKLEKEENENIIQVNNNQINKNEINIGNNVEHNLDNNVNNQNLVNNEIPNNNANDIDDYILYDQKYDRFFEFPPYEQEENDNASPYEKFKKETLHHLNNLNKANELSKDYLPRPKHIFNLGCEKTKIELTINKFRDNLALAIPFESYKDFAEKKAQNKENYLDDYSLNVCKIVKKYGGKIDNYEEKTPQERLNSVQEAIAGLDENKTLNIHKELFDKYVYSEDELKSNPNNIQNVFNFIEENNINTGNIECPKYSEYLHPILDERTYSGTHDARINELLENVSPEDEEYRQILVNTKGILRTAGVDSSTVYEEVGKASDKIFAHEMNENFLNEENKEYSKYIVNNLKNCEMDHNAPIETKEAIKDDIENNNSLVLTGEDQQKARNFYNKIKNGDPNFLQYYRDYKGNKFNLQGIDVWYGPVRSKLEAAVKKGNQKEITDAYNEYKKCEQFTDELLREVKELDPSDLIPNNNSAGRVNNFPLKYRRDIAGVSKLNGILQAMYCCENFHYDFENFLVDPVKATNELELKALNNENDILLKFGKNKSTSDLIRNIYTQGCNEYQMATMQNMPVYKIHANLSSLFGPVVGKEYRQKATLGYIFNSDLKENLKQAIVGKVAEAGSNDANEFIQKIILQEPEDRDITHLHTNAQNFFDLKTKEQIQEFNKENYLKNETNPESVCVRAIDVFESFSKNPPFNFAKANTKNIINAAYEAVEFISEHCNNVEISQVKEAMEDNNFEALSQLKNNLSKIGQLKNIAAGRIYPDTLKETLEDFKKYDLSKNKSKQEKSLIEKGYQKLGFACGRHSAKFMKEFLNNANEETYNKQFNFFKTYLANFGNPDSQQNAAKTLNDIRDKQANVNAMDIGNIQINLLRCTDGNIDSRLIPETLMQLARYENDYNNKPFYQSRLLDNGIKQQYDTINGVYNNLKRQFDSKYELPLEFFKETAKLSLSNNENDKIEFRRRAAILQGINVNINQNVNLVANNPRQPVKKQLNINEVNNNIIQIGGNKNQNQNVNLNENNIINIEPNNNEENRNRNNIVLNDDDDNQIPIVGGDNNNANHNPVFNNNILFDENIPQEEKGAIVIEPNKDGGAELKIVPFDQVEINEENNNINDNGVDKDNIIKVNKANLIDDIKRRPISNFDDDFEDENNFSSDIRYENFKRQFHFEMSDSNLPNDNNNIEKSNINLNKGKNKERLDLEDNDSRLHIHISPRKVNKVNENNSLINQGSENENIDENNIQLENLNDANVGEINNVQENNENNIVIDNQNVNQQQAFDLGYNAIIRHNPDAAKQFLNFHIDNINGNFGEEHNIPQGHIPPALLNEKSICFNATGYMTKQQAIDAFLNHKTVGILEENGDATLNVLTKTGKLRTLKMDRRDRYHKLLTNLESGTEFYNKSSEEYKNMRMYLQNLYDGKNEDTNLFYLRQNIKAYLKNYNLKKDPSRIAKFRKSLVDDLNEKIKRMYKEKNITDLFIDGLEIAETLKDYPQDIDQYIRANPYEEKVLNYELNDMDINPNEKFNNKKYIEDGHACYHDALKNIRDFAEENPNQQQNVNGFLDRAKRDFPSYQHTTTTKKWDDAIRNGRAGNLDDKDETELKADKHASILTELKNNILGSFDFYVGLGFVLALVSGLAAPGIIAAAFFKRQAFAIGGAIGIAIGSKLIDKAFAKKGPTEDEFKRFLEEHKKGNKEKEKQIRHDQIEKYFYNKAINSGRKSINISDEHEYDSRFDIAEKLRRESQPKVTKKPKTDLLDSLEKVK